MSHGIGRFLGMELVENNGISEEHLILEFADKVKIYVPSTLIHLVQKYVGATKGDAASLEVGVCFVVEEESAGRPGGRRYGVRHDSSASRTGG